MSISEDITKALDNNDVYGFIKLINNPALFINDIYGQGLLNYMLEKYPEQQLEFYIAVCNVLNTDVNKVNSAGIPPLLQTDRLDLLKCFYIINRTNITDNVNIYSKLIDRDVLTESWVIVNIYNASNEFELFSKLVLNLKFDTVNYILDHYSTRINKDILNNTRYYKPAKQLISNGRIDIIHKLVNLGCVLPDDAIFKLLELNETDVVKTCIFRVNPTNITVPTLVMLLKSFKDDDDVIKKMVSNHKRYDLFQAVKLIMSTEPEIIYTLINLYPDLLCLNIHTSVYRSYIILQEIIINLDNENRDRVLEIARSNNKLEDIKDKNMILKLFNTSLETSNRELLEYITDHIDIFDHENSDIALIELMLDGDGELVVPSKFMEDNIDNILKIRSIHLEDVLNNIIDVFVKQNSSDINKSYVRMNLYEKIVAHPNFNARYMSYLNYIIVSFVKSDNEVDQTELLRMYRILLAHPDIDVDTLDSLDNLGEDSIQYLFGKILQYDETFDYSSGEHFMLYPAMLNDLMRHPSFDINMNRKLIKYVLNHKFKGLLNRLLSMPEMDVNNLYLLHTACSIKDEPLIKQLLTVGTIDVNKLDSDGKTPLHNCIDSKNTVGALILLDDPRIDLSIVDSKGTNYIRLANKAKLVELSEALAARGQTDEKKARVDREVAEYNDRMAALGRKKEGRIRETLNSFDLILKEREHNPVAAESEGFARNETPYSLTLCPFCLTYLEKANLYECIYLNGHECPEELQNEELKRLYFGEEWASTHFEICCTCGRPCSHHGHYKAVPLDGGETSAVIPNGNLANHWRCDQYNGGGGKFEMVLRLVGMLTELKARVDRDERLVYGPELIKELAAVGNRSLFDDSIYGRAANVLGRKKWNANSKIPKYAKFNAPNVNNSIVEAEAAAEAATVERDPITHISNAGREVKIQCMICLDDETDDVFKPHIDDTGYICSDCIRRQVCGSVYNSVTCALGCAPAKQIYREDVNALMGGNFCDQG